jgi:uncharacterized repeat protein (TIGR03803 family)
MAKLMGRIVFLVCAVAISVHAQQYQLVYTFTGAAGKNPNGQLIIDAAGNIYGTTASGGPSGGAGTVFKISSSGVVSRLHTFYYDEFGGAPLGVTLDEQGNIYGTASRGGLPHPVCGTGIESGCGLIYKLDPAGKETILYSFTSLASGWGPFGQLTRDAAGNLYGVTQFGGGNFGRPCGVLGEEFCGVAFKVDPSGNETVLHAFSGRKDGSMPRPQFILDSSGNVYGVASEGGSFSGVCGGYHGCGVVYKVDPTGKQTILHTFNGADGVYPENFIADASGNMYGTTYTGGLYGGGTIFQIDAAGNFSTLYSFHDLPGPCVGLFRDPSGNFYSASGGAVFEVDVSGALTVLHTFSYEDQADGIGPFAGPILDPQGNLWGTTFYGGNSSDYTCRANGCGVVYEITH